MPPSKGGKFAYLRDPIFLVGLAIYGINREWIKPGLHAYSPFFHGHLNDTLLVPVALPVYLLFYRWIHFRPDDAPPRFWEMILHVAVWTVFFKWFGPRYLHQSVTDWIDAGCYLVGGVLAWLLWQVIYQRQHLRLQQATG